MELYVLRHAIAEDRGKSQVQDDSERVLTAEGRRKLKQVAASFDTLGVYPETIIASPYVRARQTAEVVAKWMGFEKDIIFTDSLLPDSHPQGLLDLLKRDHRDSGAVMVVGHEPHLSQFISFVLTGGDGVRVELRKAGLCKLTLHPVATLNWLLTPQQMRRIG